MATMSAKLAETGGVLQEVQRVFESSDDISYAKKVTSLHSQAVDVVAAKEEQAQKIIKEMTRRVQSAQQDATRDNEVADVTQTAKMMEEEKEALDSRVQSLDKENIGLQDEIEKVRDEKSRVIAQQATMEHESTVDVPQVKHAISLYVNISNIRWNYDSKNVEGYVSLPNVSEVRPFKFESEGMSSFEVTNALWEEMAA